MNSPTSEGVWPSVFVTVSHRQVQEYDISLETIKLYSNLYVYIYNIYIYNIYIYIYIISIVYIYVYHINNNNNHTIYISYL